MLPCQPVLFSPCLQSVALCVLRFHFCLALVSMLLLTFMLLSGTISVVSQTSAADCLASSHFILGVCLIMWLSGMLLTMYQHCSQYYVYLKVLRQKYFTIWGLLFINFTFDFINGFAWWKILQWTVEIGNKVSVLVCRAKNRELASLLVIALESYLAIPYS